MLERLEGIESLISGYRWAADWNSIGVGIALVLLGVLVGQLLIGGRR